MIPKLLLSSTSQKNRCSWMYLGTAAVWTPGPINYHPLTLTLPSVTLPPVLHVFLRFLGKKCDEWHTEVSLIPTQCIVLPSIPLFQCANCKCRYKELPPESKNFELNSDKGVVAARTQTLFDSSLRQGFEITAGSQFPLSLRAGLGPSRRQPLWVWGWPGSVRFSIYYNY